MAKKTMTDVLGKGVKAARLDQPKPSKTPQGVTEVFKKAGATLKKK